MRCGRPSALPLGPRLESVVDPERAHVGGQNRCAAAENLPGDVAESRVLDAVRELEQKKSELEKNKQELDFAGNLQNLQGDLESINEGLKQSNIYVANPYQGDPTMVVYGLNTLKNVIWDKTAGILTGDRGLTCEGFVKHTKETVIEAVGKRFPGSTVQNMIFEEKSTVKPNKSVVDWLDSVVDDNHNLVKIILPDGSEWAVDFHQYNAGNSPLMRPWSEAQADWGENYMGNEFKERIRRSTEVEGKKGR